MKNLAEIEQNISQLPEADFAKFRQWFWEYENDKWDVKIEKDIASKKLDALANKALSDFGNGKFKIL